MALGGWLTLVGGLVLVSSTLVRLTWGFPPDTHTEFAWDPGFFWRLLWEAWPYSYDTSFGPPSADMQAWYWGHVVYALLTVALLVAVVFTLRKGIAAAKPRRGLFFGWCCGLVILFPYGLAPTFIWESENVSDPHQILSGALMVTSLGVCIVALGAFVSLIATPGHSRATSGTCMAGCILSVCSFFSPLFLLSGLVISGWGYVKARRTEAPSGVGLAGLIMGAVTSLFWGIQIALRLLQRVYW